MSLTIGLDVGGTKIAAGLVDESGVVLRRVRLDSPKHDPDELGDALAVAVERLREGHDIDAVGVGAAGFVSSDRDHVFFAPHLEWGDEGVGTRLSKRTGLRVVVENDANCAAWAERTYGAGKGHRDQLMVALGTGIGGGVILDDRLHRGGHGVAAEIGHITLVEDGRLCQCGRLGCWEEYASGSALVRMAKEAAARGEAPSLLERAGSVVGITGALVTEVALAGAEDARSVFVALAHHLAAGMSTLISVLDPTLIVLGGGVSEAGDLLLHPAREALARETSGDGRVPLPEVVLAQLGNSAGMVGAADLARRDPGGGHAPPGLGPRNRGV
jgi:glucokinase